MAVNTTKVISIAYRELAAIKRFDGGDFVLRRRMIFPIQIAINDISRRLTNHHDLSVFYDLCANRGQVRELAVVLALACPEAEVGEAVALVCGNHMIGDRWLVTGIVPQHVLMANADQMIQEGFIASSHHTAPDSVSSHFQLVWGQEQWTWRIFVRPLAAASGQEDTTNDESESA